MPVADKAWWLERLQRELNPKNDDGGPPPGAASSEMRPSNRGAEDNTPEARMLRGTTRATVPARGRRFT